MSDDTACSGGLPASRLLEIDAICAAFEKQWMAGEQPPIRPWWADPRWSDAERAYLLTEMLALELEYRVQAGEQPQPGRYLSRFPGSGKAVMAAFGRLQARTLPDAAPVLRTAGDYELLRLLGRGGMGEVFLARQRSVDRLVALKLIRADRLEGLAEDERHVRVERFLLEARAAARLEHPHIVVVHEAGIADGRPYFSMQYVEGKSLAALYADQPIDGRRAAALMEPVAQAIAEAHRQGILHRDIKPGNILVEDQAQRPLVTDFGLAKLLDEEGGKTLFGEVFGSPPYMSPEQARQASAATAASDIYAIGATLYHLLTGRPPFAAPSPGEVLRQVLSAEPVSPRRLNPMVDRDLETICLKCLEKEPRRRYRSARALAEDLNRYRHDRPIHARRVGPWGRLLRWRRRNPVVAALVAMLLVTVVCGLAGTSMMWIRASWRAKQEVLARDEALQAQEAAVAARLEAEAEKRRATSAATRADDERRKAEAAAARIASTQSQLAQEKGRTELALYATHVAHAHREWLGGRVGNAEKELEACSAPLRGWEWHYLHRLCHLNLWSVHSNVSVKAVAFGPDGKRLAIGWSGKVSIWDTNTRKRLGGFDSGGTMIQCVAFSPDGKWLAASATTAARSGTTGGSRATLAVWNADGLQQRWKVDSSDSLFMSLAFSPDSKHLLTGAWPTNESRKQATAEGQSPLVLWNADTGKEIRRFGTSRADVGDVAFSPDGKHFVAGSDAGRGTVDIWDVATAVMLRSLTGHVDGTMAVAYSPDGKWIASGSRDRTVRLWDAQTGAERRILREMGDGVLCVAFTPDGASLAAGGRDNTVRIWNATTGEETRVLRGHAAGVYDLTINRQGTLIASAGWDGEVKLWDAIRDRSVTKTSCRTSQVAVFSRDGKLIAVGGGNLVTLVSADSGAIQRRFEGHASAVTALAFSANGEQVVAGERNGTTRLWEASTGKQLFAWSAANTRVKAVGCQTETTSVLSLASDGLLRAWDAKKGAETRTVRVAKAIERGACFSPAGRRLAFVDPEGATRIWDLLADTEVAKLRRGRFFGDCLAFDKTGERLLTDGSGCTVVLWNANTGAEIQTFRGLTRSARDVDFAGEGSRVLTSDGRTLRLWDAVSGQQLLVLAQTNDVWGARSDPAGRHIALTTAKGLRIYDGAPQINSNLSESLAAAAGVSRMGSSRPLPSTSATSSAAKTSPGGLTAKPQPSAQASAGPAYSFRFDAPSTTASGSGLVARLRDANPEIRSDAAYQLGWLERRSPAETEALLQALWDPDWRVHAAAAEALRRRPVGSAALVLVADTLSDKDLRRRTAAAHALGQLGTGPMTCGPALQTLLRDGDSCARLAAAYAIGRIPGHAATCMPLLAELARDRDERLRAASAYALNQADRAVSAAVPLLETLLQDKSWLVRHHALYAVAELGPPAAVFSPLRSALGDEEARVRAMAAFALGCMGAAAKDAVPDVAALLAREFDFFKARLNAAWALGRFGAGVGSVARVLTAALNDKDPQIRTAAARALLALPSEAALPPSVIGQSLLCTLGTSAAEPITTTTVRVYLTDSREASHAPTDLRESDILDDILDAQQERISERVKATLSGPLVLGVSETVLTELLQVADPHVRRCAAQALADLGHKAVGSGSTGARHPKKTGIQELSRKPWANR